MAAPVNTFKAALKSGRSQIGLWMGLAHPTTAEICASAGFDWLVIDGEHGPSELGDVLAQLRVVQPLTNAVVRPKDDDRAGLKRLLDVGAQSLLVPMIESGDQAREVVRSVMYPSKGVRGVGATLARASGYNTYDDYLTTANEQICLLLQVENRAGLAALDDILTIPEVDGIFIGPADLSADMGFPGQPAHPEVLAAIQGAFDKISVAGKARGILTGSPELAAEYQAAGVEFLAVGSDVGALGGAVRALRATFKP